MALTKRTASRLALAVLIVMVLLPSGETANELRRRMVRLIRGEEPIRNGPVVRTAIDLVKRRRAGEVVFRDPRFGLTEIRVYASRKLPANTVEGPHLWKVCLRCHIQSFALDLPNFARGSRHSGRNTALHSIDHRVG